MIIERKKFERLVTNLRASGYDMHVSERIDRLYGYTKKEHVEIGFCTPNDKSFESLRGRVSVIRCSSSLFKNWDRGIIILPIPEDEFETTFLLSKISEFRMGILKKRVLKYDITMYGLR